MDRVQQPWPKRIGLAVLAIGCAAVGVLATRALLAWPGDPIATARSASLAVATAAIATGSWLLLCGGRSLGHRLLLRPRLLRVAMAGAATLLAFVASEGALRLGGVFAHQSDIEPLSRPFVEPDPRLGYRLIPSQDIEVTLVRTRDAAEVGHVHYGIDARGHRRTVAPLATGHERAVLFFGCSQTFGHGLDDVDTVPSRYAAAMPRDLVINLAVPGYGPQHALVQAGDPATLALPSLPRPPVAVWTWIDHHLLRLCGSLRVRNAYGIDAPSFAIEADGHAHLRGPFRSAEPVRTAWFWALGKSRVLQLCGYDWPGRYRDQDQDLAAAVFEGLARALQPVRGRLLIAQYPKETTGQRLATRLQGTGIAYVDLGQLFDPYAPGMSIDRDGHPTPAATALLGTAIAEAVRRAFP